MKTEVKKHGIILEKTELQFEENSVLNPAIYQEGNIVHVFYRAVAEGNYSSIGYARLNGPLEVAERYSHPVLVADNAWESHGVEDPRITRIGDTFYMPYTAYDGRNTIGALVISKDLKSFTRKGIITPQLNYRQFKAVLDRARGPLNEKYLKYYNLFKEIGLLSTDRLVRDKDIVFFPRKINGKYAFLHRIYPGIQVVYYEDIEDLNDDFWLKYLEDIADYIVIDPKRKHEVAYVGAGCPPIETESGWLLIYHSVHDTVEGKVYHATAALLDLEDPTIEIARLKEPLFSPEHTWEKEGIVSNVVFPTGTAIFDDDLYIYYGAADHCISVASVELEALISTLKELAVNSD